MNSMNQHPIYPSIFTKAALRQACQLLRRIRRAIKKKRFFYFSKKRQYRFIKRLHRYLKRLKKTNLSIRPLIKELSFVIVLLGSKNMVGQNFIQPGGVNPLGLVNVGTNSFPAFVDIDGDGLQDAFVGSGDGTIQFFRNVGTATTPVFMQITGVANPFNGENVGGNAAPYFMDIDGDGDQDAFIGEFDGIINFFRNDGNSTAPVFTEITGAANPFNGIDVGTMSAPNLVDIDGDGDLDAFISGNNTTLVRGEISFFRNDGGTFTSITGTGNPFNNAPIGVDPMLTFVDFDGDGDLDAFVGSQLGMIQYFQNNGTSNLANFSLVTGAANPFDGVDIGRNGTLIPNPCFIDIDNDGNQDVFIGNLDGTINFFQQAQNITCPTNDFFKVDASLSPFNGIDVGRLADPEFFDIDGDGDLDLLAGSEVGNIRLFRNEQLSFQEVIGNENPFNGQNVGMLSSIELVDIDGDNDQDAFIGENDGIINFFRNDGNNITPIFIPISGASNPFDGVDIGEASNPVFVDIDGDGDQDAFIGDEEGRLQFFRNTGNRNNPVFTQINDTNNPFFGIDLEARFSPDFIDIDGDGDFDAIIGNKAGNLYFFRNDGTSTTPSFNGLFGDCNPFHQLIPVLTNQEEFSAPAFADFDGDGTVEALVGLSGGGFCLLDQRSLPLRFADATVNIPTLSQWGLLILGLLILNIALHSVKHLEKIKKGL